MLKKILVLLLVAVGGFVAFAATRPDTYRVLRSTSVAAPPAVIFAHLNDFKSWAAWSPWEKRDPQIKKTFEGPPAGVGSIYSWQGNKDVGQGKMSIVASEPPAHLRVKLEFIEPFAAVADTEFSLASEEGQKTSVAWSMQGKNNLMGKVFGIFMDMDKTVGADFDTGLAALRTIAEEEASKRAAAEAQAVAAAEAQEKKVAAEAAAAASSAAAEAATTKGKNKRKR